MRILFMGTPDFSAELLSGLAAAGHEIAGVFTQPVKPRGRGHNLLPSPVAIRAEELGIPCFEPATLRDDAAMERLRQLDPEVNVVAAYGKILPAPVLYYPKYGSVNVHASLLPRWRGAAPIQRAIMAGDTETGVTIMQMDEGLDTGGMYRVSPVAILPEDDTGTLTEKLLRAGTDALLEVLGALAQGTAAAVRQPDEGMTYAAKIEKEEGILDFRGSAKTLSCRIRGLSPSPMAMTRCDGKLLKIASAIPVEIPAVNAVPGTVIDITKEGFLVACGEGALLVTEVVPEGKRKMPAADFARGKKDLCGGVLSWE